MAEINSLPPGWDSKYDSRTNRYYYINHYTRVTTWEDPRGRYRQIHGTPSNVPTMQGEHIPLQEMNSIRMSPVATKVAHALTATRSSPSTARVHETSMSTVQDTEASVSKISMMFPTVSETHIRLLLKKYMKSLFPKADEMIILDVLGNNDNNVQKTSEALKEMGYEKADNKIKKTATKPEQPRKVQPKEVVVPKMKTLQEKNQMKTSLEEKYKDVPERVIVIALESVDYDKDKAIQILEIMVQEEKSPKNSKEPSPKKKEESKIEAPSTVKVKTPITILSPIESDKVEMGKNRRTKEKANSLRNSQDKILSQDMGYTSQYLLSTIGHNPTLVKGSDDGMLLEDYMTWDGPNPHLRKGVNNLALGPNAGLLSKRTYETRGHNTSLCRGPVLGLAKGSIYSQLKTAVVGESRGK